MMNLDTTHLTSTQIGAIGESVTASGLILASGGRLAPFTPMADDDGIDLLIYDKLTRQALPLQIKSRTRVDDLERQTVQFDVRKTTLNPQGGSHLLALLMDGAALKRAWLVPMEVLPSVTTSGDDVLRMVPSAKTTSKDRFTPYRHDGFADLARQLIGVFEGNTAAA